MVSSSEQETIYIAGLMAEFVYSGLTIHLSGDLGAGKTVFVRGISRPLGVDYVRSPSFTLVNEYHGQMPIAHVDLYRLEPGEETDLDLDSYVDDGYLLIVEWAEKMTELPEEDLWTISIHSNQAQDGSFPSENLQKRRISFNAYGNKAQRHMEAYLKTLKKETSFQ